jgi:hypothetical protein
MDDETLLDLLSMNPTLRSRIESVLKVAGNFDDNIELADTAEEKLIEIGRHLNRAALQEWANNKAIQSSNNFEKKHKASRKDIKKKSIGTPHLG